MAPQNCDAPAAPQSESPLLTVTEVSQLMRVSKMTVYRLVHSGKLRAVRIGKVVRIPTASVQEFLGDAWDSRDR